MSSLLTTGLISQDFEPRDFSGLILWFDAQDSSTITLSGTDVTQWNDKSASANHAIGGAIKPRYDSPYNINGYSTVDFKGSSGARMDTTNNINITGSQERDCFTVVKFDSGWTGEYAVWFHGSTTFPFGRAWAPWWNLSTPRWGLSRYGADGRTSLSITLNTGLILEVSHDNTNGVNFAGINMYVNDPETALTWETTTSANTNTINSKLTLGFYTGTAILKGQIGELLYYNRRLTTIERREVFWYLKKKWGL
jgi:hypothetical protein